MFYKHRFRRFAHGDAREGNDVSERVAHHSRSDRVAKRQPMRAFDAARPGEGAHDVTSAGNREDEKETCAEALNAVEDLADARAPHEVGKEQQSQNTENDA